MAGLFSPAALERAERIGHRPLDPGLPEPEDRDRQLQAEPDLQHPVAEHAGDPGRAGAVAERQRRPGLGRGPHRRLRLPRLRLGRGLRVATPYVVRAEDRSNVIATIDFDESIDAAAVAKALRANGVVDTEPCGRLSFRRIATSGTVSLFGRMSPPARRSTAT